MELIRIAEPKTEQKEKKETKEEKIVRLKEEIKTLNEQGRFKSFYTMLRKGTVSINKQNTDDEKKKEDLIALMIKVSTKIQECE